jgi:hypothetical protein
MNIHLSRQTNFDLTPSRTISLLQYERLVDFKNDYPYYTLKVHFKRGAIQDYVMTSIPMVCIHRVVKKFWHFTISIQGNDTVIFHGKFHS